MTNEQCPPTNVGSTAGLGVTDSIRAEFQRFLDANGELTRLGVASFAWCAWLACRELAEKELATERLRISDAMLRQVGVTLHTVEYLDMVSGRKTPAQRGH